MKADWIRDCGWWTSRTFQALIPNMRAVILLLPAIHAMPAQQMDPPPAAKPTVWLIGDSTVNVSTPGQVGWGEVIGHYFDPEKASIVNRAVGGRSSRTFIAEGRWERIKEELKAGDFVLMQFGHNDAGPINDNFRARGSLRGTGDESVEIDNLLTGRHETVHTFGHYMRQYVRETREAGAIPVVLSLVPRKLWEDGRLQRDADSYAGWARTAAEQAGAAFIDLNEIVARGYESLGPAQVDRFFADEHTHTNKAGAVFNAEALVAGLKALGEPFRGLLGPGAESVAPVADLVVPAP